MTTPAVARSCGSSIELTPLQHGCDRAIKAMAASLIGSRSKVRLPCWNTMPSWLVGLGTWGLRPGLTTTPLSSTVRWWGGVVRESRV